MKNCRKLAVERMTVAREERKRWYDEDAVERTFKVGDKVLILALVKTNILRKLDRAWSHRNTTFKD